MMAEIAVKAYREAKPEVADDTEFQRVESCVERLAKWSRSQEAAAGGFSRFTFVVFVAAGLFIVHAGSWVPKPPE